MGWFESQIEERKKLDSQQLSKSLVELSDAVTGKRRKPGKNDIDHAEDALSEILKYYGATSEEAPRAADDIQELIDWKVQSTGIMDRPVTLKGAWYKDAVGAMLGFLQDDTPIALLPRRGGYAYRDPATGDMRSITSANAHTIKQAAWCFYRPLPQRTLSLWDLILFMIRSLDFGDYVAVFAATLVSVLLGLLVPIVNQQIFGPVIASGTTSVVLPIAALLVSVTFSQIILESIKSLVLSRIATRQSLPLEAALMMRILHFPAAFFRNYSTGELATRIGTIKEIVTILQNAVFSTLLTSVFSLVYIVQIAVIAPALSLPAFLIIAATTTLSIIVMFVQLRVTRRSLNLQAKISGWQLGLINGMQKIKLTGSETRAFSSWAHKYQELARLTYNPPMFLRLAKPIQIAVATIGCIVMYVCAIQGGVSVPEYMAFVSAYGMVDGAFLTLSGAARQIATIKPHLELAEPILKEVPETSEKRPAVKQLSGSFHLDSVHFSYGESSLPVLKGLSLKVRRGEYVGIVGKTGCGKSTIMRLLLGFETPDRGAVFYDSHDLAKVDAASIRQHIGAVLQDGKLFQGTIFENIAISAPQLTIDEAWEAAELAGIADDIRRMPMGMHTFISEGQGGVSGGQHQRLMIARALASKPSILMFDEATSALDNITQKHISDSLDTLKCTRLVIAHRLSTIQQCDRIVVIDDGRVAEEGTYEELLRKNGLFAKLVERQQL